MPTLEEASPKLRELEASRARLHAERAGLIQKAADLRARKRTQYSEADFETARTEEIIAGKSPSERLSLDETIIQTLREIEDLNKAINIVETRIWAEKTSASRVVCDAVRDQHENLLTEVAKKLIEITRLEEQRHALLNSIEAVGASTDSLDPVLDGKALSHPRDHSSPIGYHLRDCATRGLISRTEIPEGLR